MQARGSNKNVEYKREDHSFYKGIVLDNNDPNRLMRVKVFIPEVSNQHIEWFKAYKTSTQSFRAPGKQGPLQSDEVNTLRKLLPWAEQMAPLFGELGTSHYYADEGEQRSKATYVKTAVESQTPNAKTGGLPPRETVDLYTGELGQSMGDAWVSNEYGKSNVYGNAYTPKNSGPGAAGVYGVPPVGSHVWVFHQYGDLSLPVYFGGVPSARETKLVWNGDEGTYPGPYENSGNTLPEPGSSGEEVDTGSSQSAADPETYGGAQVSPGNFRATAYGLASIDPTTADDQRKADAGVPGYEEFSQTRGASGRELIPGYSVASNYFTQGTLLMINGKEYRVDDTGSQKYLGNDGIDFFSGSNRQQYDAFKVMKIESIQVIGQYKRFKPL